MTYTTPITDWTAVDPVSATDFNTQIIDNIEHLHSNLPTRATLWHGESTVTAGNALLLTINVGQLYNGYHYQNASADADSFTQTLTLASGTYTMYILGRTSSNNGKIDWKLNATTIASGQDWYTGGNVLNVIKTVASIVITDANAGRQVLTGTVNGKNAGSSGYDIQITKIYFKQATDA